MVVPPLPLSLFSTPSTFRPGVSTNLLRPAPSSSADLPFSVANGELKGRVTGRTPDTLLSPFRLIFSGRSSTLKEDTGGDAVGKGTSSRPVVEDFRRPNFNGFLPMPIRPVLYVARVSWSVTVHNPKGVV